MDPIVKEVIIKYLQNEGVVDAEAVFNSLNNIYFLDIDFDKLRKYIQGDIKNESIYFVVKNADEIIAGYDNELMNRVISNQVIQLGRNTFVAGTIKLDKDIIPGAPGAEPEPEPEQYQNQ
jgi:hypothetical protein